MSTSILEKTRFLAEDIERYEQAMEKELTTQPRTQKAKTQQQHNIVKYMDTIQREAGEALTFYADKDSRRAEIDAMSKGDIFKAFYSNLEDIQQYHQKFPSLVEKPIVVEPVDLDNMFTAEEFYGKYVDMHEIYEKFVNLPHISRVDYITYLSTFYVFKDIHMETKLSSRYSDYLNDIVEYITTFYHRSQPLFDVDGLIQEIRSQFDVLWSAEAIDGWNMRRGVLSELEETKKKLEAELVAKQKERESNVNDIDYEEEIVPQRDIPDYSSVEACESLGGDKLKSLLLEMGAKCGGSVHQRAERLYTIMNTKGTDVPLHMLRGSRSHSKAGQTVSVEALKPVAEREYIITELCENMKDVLDATQAFNEKKTIQSYDERQKDEEDKVEVDEELEEDETNGDDEEKPIYNPLNLPLGWDGKPIPYWLYKLHGLGEEFTCEICGNHSYWGQRAFDNHFQEWRHHNGMRCLGIPNTKHFHDITSIEDAKNLYEKIKDQLKTEDWALDEEEFEDADGNVLSKKMYNDLVRQGLI